jgi:magnesium chelatase family protein
VLLLGPPGAGKSRLAHRLTTILPAMTLPEALKTTRIHSVAGLTGDHTALMTTCPGHIPHHIPRLDVTCPSCQRWCPDVRIDAQG